MISTFEYPDPEGLYLDEQLIIILSFCGVSLFCCGAIVTMCIVKRYNEEKRALVNQIKEMRQNPNLTAAEIYGIDEDNREFDFYGVNDRDGGGSSNQKMVRGKGKGDGDYLDNAAFNDQRGPRRANSRVKGKAKDDPIDWMEMRPSTYQKSAM